MRILFVHEVNYREKVVFEMHDFPELLMLAGHEVLFIDFAEGGERTGLRSIVDWRTEESVVENRAHLGAKVTVRTPGRLLPPPIDRLIASFTQVPVIYRAIRNWSPDVVMLYGVPTNGWQTVLVARRLGVPVLFRALDISHELRPTVFRPLIEKAERFIYRRASRVSANNVALARYVVEAGASVDRVSVDYPGLDLDRFQPGEKSASLRSRYGIDDGDQVVQFMGTLYRFSGLDWLIDELAPALRSRPNLKLMLVGGGEAEADLRAKVADLDLDDRVIFTGWIPYADLADHLRLADLNVTPFAEELVANCALPSKILQYAGCGVPTVCSRLEGMQGMLPEGRGVIYRAPGKAFTDAALAWLDDAKALAASGVEARRQVEKLCRWETALAGLEAALDATIRSSTATR